MTDGNPARCHKKLSQNSTCGYMHLFELRFLYILSWHMKGSLQHVSVDFVRKTTIQRCSYASAAGGSSYILGGSNSWGQIYFICLYFQALLAFCCHLYCRPLHMGWVSILGSPCISFALQHGFCLMQSTPPLLFFSNIIFTGGNLNL